VRALTLERWLKHQLSVLLVWLLRPGTVTPDTIASASVRRLLVIRQHNQMGDMVLALPALGALRRAFRGATLTFVAGPLSDALLRGHPDIDHLVVYRKREMFRPWNLWRFVRRLRSERPDLAIVMGTVSFSVTSALLAWASGARLRAGLSSRPWGSALSGALYQLEIAQPVFDAHEVEHNLRFVRALGIDAPMESPHLVPSPAARSTAAGFLADTFPKAPSRIVVMHVGAGKLSNLWPVERFAAVARRLAEELDVSIVVTEGPRDQDAVAKFRHHVPEAAHWQNDLVNTLGILSCANLYIGNDTGMSHVAAAVGAPCLVVFGPHDATRWAPAGPAVQTISPESHRIEDVRVNEVYDEAVRMLVHARHAH